MKGPCSSLLLTRVEVNGSRRAGTLRRESSCNPLGMIAILRAKLNLELNLVSPISNLCKALRSLQRAIRQRSLTRERQVSGGSGIKTLMLSGLHTIRRSSGDRR